jgi:phenylacetate-CoA ligase
MELITDDGTPITKNGVRGRVLITDLVRRLHPVIRCPLGDLAEWIDYDMETFTLCGRETVALKIGPLFLSLSLLRSLVAETLGEKVVDAFQVIVRRTEGKNEVTVRAASQPNEPEAMTRQLEKRLIESSPKWREYLDWLRPASQN